MFKKNDSPAPISNGSPSLNMISEGSRLNGDLHSENDIRIAGQLEGEGHSKGKVIITSTGKVTGQVKASEADIAGELDGMVYVTGKLVLRGSAVINGDIHTKTLLVEEGAQIRGNCKMSSDEAELAGAGSSDVAEPQTEAAN